MSCNKKNGTCDKDMLLCGKSMACLQPEPLVICSMYEKKPTFDISLNSERNCQDFSDLCEDQPKKCKKEKKCLPKIITELNDDSDFSDGEPEMTVSKNLKRKSNCRGCNTMCRTCPACVLCTCQSCRAYRDYSRTSALADFETSDCSDRLGCPPNFMPLKCDRKKECVVPCIGKGKTMKFTITFGDKNEHQWNEYMSGNKAMYVNGKVGPVLHLYRGATYYFVIEQPEGNTNEHYFLLTKKPGAGVNSRPIDGSFAPVSSGTVCYKPDSKTPRLMFYGCTKDSYVGGMVMVHD